MLDFTDMQVEQLKQFHKENFDPSETVEAARELKDKNLIKRALSEEMKEPTEDFVRFVLTRIEYPGQKTRLRIKQFTPLVQEAFTQFVNDRIDARLKSALEAVVNCQTNPPPRNPSPSKPLPSKPLPCNRMK